MDFCKPKQPIALPLDPEDEKLLKPEGQSDPELAGKSTQQQQQPGNRCCFRNGSRGRKVVRRVGHLVILSAFLYWIFGRSVNFYHGEHKPLNIELPEFTDFGVTPPIVPEDFSWVGFGPDEELKCDKYVDWSEPKEIKRPCHHRHRKPPHHPDGPKPPHHPDHPHEPDHPREPGHPHGPPPEGDRPSHPPGPDHPDGPDHPHGPDHPNKPDHPHGPDHPHKPHHPHKPGHPHKPHHPHWPGHRPRGPKYASEATFKLPLSESALLFYSHGPSAYGGVKFYQDDSDSLNSDEVEVTIHARIWDKSALKLSKVCSLKREHGAGLGIWTELVEHGDPEERKRHELALRIFVKFPKHPDPLEIEKLQAHMPLFAQHFQGADLKIKDLEVTSLFLPIKAEALHVDRGQLRTENSPIVGNFTATKLLVLETRNSPIAANITLFNDDDDDVSSVFIKTSNSPVYGNISLVASTEDHAGGKFSVDAFTSNAPLHVDFADAPVDSVLRFTGMTSNSPALAALHPTYQGEILAKSTLLGPRVDVNPNVKDPEGEGRTRTVDISKVGRQIVGKVFWGSEEDSKDSFGRVELSSTLLRATLKL